MGGGEGGLRKVAVMSHCTAPTHFQSKRSQGGTVPSHGLWMSRRGGLSRLAANRRSPRRNPQPPCALFGAGVGWITCVRVGRLVCAKRRMSVHIKHGRLATDSTIKPVCL